MGNRISEASVAGLDKNRLRFQEITKNPEANRLEAGYSIFYLFFYSDSDTGSMIYLSEHIEKNPNPNPLPTKA
jgi:hypothetical protein